MIDKLETYCDLGQVCRPGTLGVYPRVTAAEQYEIVYMDATKT